MKYRHTFKTTAKFSSWLFSIAYNARNSAYRKRFSRFHINQTDLDELAYHEPVDSEAQPYSALSRKQDKATLYEALEKLPLEKRQILIMRHIQSLNYEEIGVIMGVESSTMRVRVHRALNDLKIQLHQLLKENPYELSEH
jgi:RNA polymerase sigma factor (sigma-70 family)